MRIVKRNEGLLPSRACGTLEHKEKRFAVQKKYFGRGWQVGTPGRVPDNNSGNREKVFRGTGHSNNITAIILSLCLGEKGFRNSLKHAF